MRRFYLVLFVAFGVTFLLYKMLLSELFNDEGVVIFLREAESFSCKSRFFFTI